MRIRGLNRRLLSLIMAAAICFSLIPWAVFAAENGAYTQVTSAEEFTTGQYILITETGYAPGVLEGSWITALTPSAEGDAVIDTAGAVWTLTVEGNTVRLTDPNGVSVSPKGGNTNGILSGDYSWVWSFADGKVTFAGAGADTVVLASNTGAQGRFRAYRTSAVSGNPAAYPSAFTAYRLVEDNREPENPAEPKETETPTEPEAPTEPGVPTEPETPPIVIPDGDYVIWAPAYGKALSSGKTGNYNLGVDVTQDGGVLSGYGETEIWTVTNHGDGTITISQNGNKLSVAEVYANLTLDGIHDTWTLLDLGDGLFNVQNTGRLNYLEWNDKFSNWSSYRASSAATDSRFQIRFTPAAAQDEPEVPIEPEVPAEPEIPEEPETSPIIIPDDDYVIWAPAYGKALSGETTGYYNAGTDVFLDGESLSGYGETEIWTVMNNEDGTITISRNGSKLSMDDRNSGLTMDGENDTWTLVPLGDGLYNLQNVGRGSFLEWYGKFSIWSAQDAASAETDSRFQLRFTPARRITGADPSAVEPVKFTPNGGGVYLEGDCAEISLSTATEGATIWFATSADGEVYSDYAVYSAPIVIAKGFGRLYVRAYAEKEGFAASPLTEKTFTERISGRYQLFFGQLHAHSNISDGAHSVEEAFRYASGVEGLDFLAITDHSNSFDNADSGVLCEDGTTVSTEWAAGHAAAAAVTDEDFVGLYGFEMTWSNGLGHINTFNTPGWQSRTQDQYQSFSTALQNYYDTLATVPGSISQFNHPGTMFGDFSDFAHYSEAADALITLIEVGNGEGAVGSSGYFTAYGYYTRALDKGWHLAPTNNQNNHEGQWGDANTGRSVILAESLTVEGICDALRSYRVYATEDNDLEIYYTMNGCVMGSILDMDHVGEDLPISVRFFDPTDAAIGKVEVIVNGGLSIASQTLDTHNTTAELTVPADYDYYYIRVTQPDGDIAVTAPVWLEKAEAVGIAGLATESAVTIAGQEQMFTAELFNKGSQDLMVESLVFTNKETGEVLYTETGVSMVAKESTVISTFGYTFASDGVYTITATLKGTVNGVEKTCTRDLEVTVIPRNIVSRVVVDGTHFNDYVTGCYSGSMNNMTAIAAARGIEVHVETDQITPQLLEDCSLLVITGPACYDGTHNTAAFTAAPFADDFLRLVADYVRDGGSVLVCGLADSADKAADLAGNHKSAQLNRLLAAIGSTMTIHDDAAYDPVRNGGDPCCLYPDQFNTDSVWCEGIRQGQVYIQQSGATVNPGRGTWLVRGFESTCSVDSDGDGVGSSPETLTDGEQSYHIVVPGGETVLLAAEETPYGGTIFAAGGVFISDFALKAQMDNSWDLPDANRTIWENILGITRTQPKITSIAAVRASAAEEPGRIFILEGYVTSGTENDYTTFTDTIYVQDETGGIAVLPYAQRGLVLGTKVRVTGYTDSYQGDIGLRTLSVEVLDAPKNVIEPEKVSAGDAMDYAENGGKLLQVEGEVVQAIPTADGRGIAQFVVKDENGDLARVFIDGCIRSGITGENTLAEIAGVGNTVSAVGLVYMHAGEGSDIPAAVLRVRNCDEVVLIRKTVAEENPADPTEPVNPSKPTEPSGPTEPSEPIEPSGPTEPSEATESSEPVEPSGSETDKSLLKKAIQKAKSRKQKEYTQKSYNAMLAVLKIAEAVYADEDATQAEIDAATDALNAVIDALIPATGKNPETSDSVRILLPMLTMAVSVLAAAVLLVHRRRFAVE